MSQLLTTTRAVLTCATSFLLLWSDGEPRPEAAVSNRSKDPRLFDHLVGAQRGWHGNCRAPRPPVGEQGEIEHQMRDGSSRQALENCWPCRTHIVRQSRLFTG